MLNFSGFVKMIKWFVGSDVKRHFISIYISLDRGSDLTTYVISGPHAPVVGKYTYTKINQINPITTNK